MRLLRSTTPWHRVAGDTFVEVGDPGFEVSYTGGFAPTWFGNHPGSPPFEAFVDPDSYPSFGEASQFGAEGWNRFRPTLAGMDLTSALYELKDLPDMLKTSSRGFDDLYRSSMEKVGIGTRSSRAGRILRDHAMNPNYLAEHFLNHAFGWSPFIGDLLSLYDTVRDGRNTVQRMKRENGKFVHRRGTIRKINTTSEELYSDHYAYVTPDIAGLTRWDTAPDGNSTRGYSRFVHDTYERTWFSAEFKYWIPELNDADYNAYSRIMVLARRYGIRVNPAVIWKLTPWSWLADWFVGTSQFYKSVAEYADDNLVARYAYVMRHLVMRTRHFATVFLVDGRDATMDWVRELESKHRAKASPFGFNLSSSELSGRQIAILAALGITRSW
jgi:hypothetical protein